MSKKRDAGESNLGDDTKCRRVRIGEAEIRLMSRKPKNDQNSELAPIGSSDNLIYVVPPPCIIFHSFEELSNGLTTYFDTTNQEFSIRNSITVESANETSSREIQLPTNDGRFKYSTITYACKYGRTQKRRNNPNLTKSKKVKFSYLGCQASISISLILMGTPGQRRWVYHIHKMFHAHTHELHPNTQVASLRPFRMHLDKVYEMKHAGATPHDILRMLSEREPTKKITIQTVRNILRNYAKELDAPTPPVRVRALPRVLQPLPTLSPSAMFHRLFSTIAKVSIESHISPQRLIYLNMSMVDTSIRSSWTHVETKIVQHMTDKCFNATVLTAVAADGSTIPPFCVLPRSGADRQFNNSTSERLPFLQNCITSDNGLVTPEAIEFWIMHLHAALHPRMPRPVVVLVDHVTISTVLYKICARYGIVVISWKDLYAGDKDVVGALKNIIFEPFEAQLCRQLGRIVPQLSTPHSACIEVPAIALEAFQATIAAIGVDSIQSAFRDCGLMPLSLPVLAKSIPPQQPQRSTLILEEQRVATISVQTNIMPRYAMDR